MNKKPIFAILTICCFLECLSRSLIMPFFPPYASEKGISDVVIGIVIACNPFGSFFASLILGKILNKRNRYFYMISGLLVQSVGTYLFVATYYTDDPLTIVIIAVVARIISGIGVQLFMTPYYAFIPILYPKDVEQMIGIAEIASGAGFMVGPALGSVVFSLGNYTTPFIVFGTSSLLAAPISYYFIRKFEDNNVETLLSKSQIAYNAESQVIPEKERIGYIEMLTIYSICIIVLIEVTANVVFTFCSPTIATYLEKQYNSTPDNVGYYISLCSVCYVFSCALVAKIKRGRKEYIMFGTVSLGFIYLFMGPDKQFTGLDHNIYVTLASWTLMGGASSFLWILCLPLMNDIVVQKYPLQPERCANLSSGLLNAAISLGDLLGPVLGGLFYQIWGFEKSCSIIAFSVFFVAFLFIPILFQKTESQNKSKIMPGSIIEEVETDDKSDLII